MRISPAFPTILQLKEKLMALNLTFCQNKFKKFAKNLKKMSKLPKRGNDIDYDAILSGLGFDPTEFDILEMQSSSKPL